MDITQHGEEAYSEGEGAVLVFREAAPAIVARSTLPTAGAA
jgi:hypothetical protein